MEDVKKIAINLEFEDGEISVPIRPASYAVVTEVMKAELEAVRILNELDKQYEKAYEKIDGSEEYKIKDPVAFQEKVCKIADVIMKRDIKIASIIIDTKNLSVKNKEEMLDEGFWHRQRYIEEIKPAVESFRAAATVKFG
jgi:hypothetical protein